MNKNERRKYYGYCWYVIIINIRRKFNMINEILIILDNGFQSVLHCILVTAILVGADSFLSYWKEVGEEWEKKGTPK